MLFCECRRHRATLVALIFTFGPISGAHSNPVVTLADASQRGIDWREVPRYFVDLLRHDAGDRFEVESAGTKPSQVPEAMAVMRELGIDISRHRSKSVDEFAGQSFDYVLIVCDKAKETCPIYPGHANRLHHDFEDPAATRGPEEERLAAFRRIRDEIREYLKGFPGESDRRD